MNTEIATEQDLSPAVQQHKSVAVTTESPPCAVAAPPDAKQLRVEHIGALLGEAYKGASSLKLNKQEQKELREDFPDESVEIRPHDGIIYISHMALRERLWDVFGSTNVAEICRERFIRSDTNEVAVDLVLMVRGVFVAEGVGTAKYYPNNPKASFGDTVESAWSDALRHCCKKIGVGTQVWRPQYVRDWLEKYSYQEGGKYRRKSSGRVSMEQERTTKPTRKAREYKLRETESTRLPEPPESEGEPLPF